jgi:nucleoside-diphosphate kinase
MAEECTLVLIKPDGLVRSLTGNILTKLAEARLRIIGAKIVKVSDELARKHYAHLKDKPFYEGVIEYIKGKPYGKKYERVFAFVYSGENAIKWVRKICGETNPEEAEPISIRGAYGRITSNGVFENVIHSSEDKEKAEREIKMWFNPDEIVEEIYPTKTVIVKEEEKRVWK